MKKILGLVLSVVFAVPALAQAPKGATDPKVTQENIKSTICVSGYTARVRPSSSYTNRLKLKQMKAAGLKGTAKDYEEDHLIPLALGGDPVSSDNLWPQPLVGADDANNKDRLETKLHSLVCSGKVPLKQAQDEISSDWHKAYQKYVK